MPHVFTDILHNLIPVLLWYAASAGFFWLKTNSKNPLSQGALWPAERPGCPVPMLAGQCKGVKLIDALSGTTPYKASIR